MHAGGANPETGFAAVGPRSGPTARAPRAAAGIIKEEHMKKNEITVKINLPYIRGVAEDDVFVSVNCRTWRIKRGMTVELPVCAAEVLQTSQKAERYAALQAEKLAKNAE